MLIDKVPPICGRLSVMRCAATGVAVLAVAFALCWFSAMIGNLPFSHMYVALFTTAPLGSIGALAEGLSFSIGAGAVVGALIALAYNAAAFLER